MKKLLAILLTLTLVLSVSACGSGKNQDQPATDGAGTSQADGGDAGSADGQKPEEGTAEESTAQGSAAEGGTAEESTAQGGTAEITDALALLNAIWDSYGEDEKFPAAGGDFSEENAVTDAPGRYSIEDGAALDSVLGLPEDAAGKIDGAASLTHMMNANTFTCGVFHVGSGEDVASVTASLRDNILQRQWMCGFPDKLVVITAGDYVISAFGDEEMIDTFKAKAMSVCEPAVLAYEEWIE